MSRGSSLYQLTFQISPIILTGSGIVGSIPGGALPIVLLTNTVGFVNGLLNGEKDAGNPDNYFAQFVPITGATLIDNEIGKYPFANQAVAANAVITNPLTFSMKMICPYRSTGSALAKLLTMTALQSSLQQHNTNGGTYTVATPSYIYTDCLMTAMRDISSGESKQPQYEWQFDFVQPLLTLEQAAALENSLISKITSQTPLVGDPPPWSGLSTLVGSATSITAPSIIPAASGAGAAGVSGLAAFGQ